MEEEEKGKETDGKMMWKRWWMKKERKKFNIEGQ